MHRSESRNRDVLATQRAAAQAISLGHAVTLATLQDTQSERASARAILGRQAEVKTLNRMLNISILEHSSGRTQL